ncbi:golvesin C-terminal-like domain-containing protein [Prevotella sp.]|uniref:golvesin C-terminal-like domain-containing protein n=2 Tax=Prevotella sp. TaxID=59823 RepID=UPI00307BF7C2
MNRVLSILFCAFSMVAVPSVAGSNKMLSNEKVGTILKNYVLQSRAKNVHFQAQPYLEKFSVDERSRELKVYISPSFATQEFTEKSVKFYYKRLSRTLPKPYNKYSLSIVAAGLPIEQLVAGAKVNNTGVPSAWGKIEYDGAPWVYDESKPYFITHGLFDRHISLWASHGMFYDTKKSCWRWQRPNLFCTTEDLFTQTMVVPYLIPMLERAGAIVYTPRERDWQKNEVLVDNDNGRGYVEDDGREKWRTAQAKGFAPRNGVYRDGENPFLQGTARQVRTVRKGHESWASYQPQIPQAGRYAVYVSYQTLPNSVSDVQYIVCHKGQRTLFRVNQQMGGGTWVYLGTFDFDSGSSTDNRVIITNLSDQKGVITTDAVRFGGGMGNVQRYGVMSGMPRCLEGARYNAQWSGAPYSVYGGKNGTDDYSDDINSRSNMTNWLAGGSVYVPTREGKKVPIELSLAVHSDAGYTSVPDSIIGSLSICTTNFNDGRLGSGISRMTSHDFAEQLLEGLRRDLTFKYGKWTRRYLWDRNYSETRRPEVPSAIIETMSHQNFADIRRGLDPNFKFTMARSLYKTILRYVSSNHSRPCIVQPLPVDNFRIANIGNGQLRLSWLPVKDEQEPTSVPTAYNVYVAQGAGGFDNGRMVCGNSFVIDVQPGVVYKFRVAAVNRGGESFPSETLAACLSSNPYAKNILVVNGFKRLSGPAVVDNETQQGFDLDADIGVSYGLTAGWNGRQQCFDRSRAGSEGPGAMGYCGDELAGFFVMGNQQNESVCHAENIATAGDYNVVSSSLEALENDFTKPSDYDVMDIAFGLQKDDGHSMVRYKTFTSRLRNQLKTFVSRGGRVMVSGAYVGSDMLRDDERRFLSDVVKVAYERSDRTRTNNMVNGLGINFDIIRNLNSVHYAATSVDVMHPSVSSAFCAMQYADGSSAAVAYDGGDYKSFVMGFPFECINNMKARRQVMKAVMDFLVKR